MALRISERIKNWLWRIAYAVLILGIIGAWISPSERSHEGDRCGPHHHWRYINVGMDGSGDLSCEPDQPRVSEPSN